MEYIVNELGYEVKLKWRLKLYKEEQFLMEVGMEFYVAGELQLKVHKKNQQTYMTLGVVVGVKNGELMMAGVVGGDCRDKMADRLPNPYRLVQQFSTEFDSELEASGGNYIVSGKKATLFSSITLAFRGYFYIFIPLKTGINTPQSHTIYLLNDLMTS